MPSHPGRHHEKHLRSKLLILRSADSPNQNSTNFVADIGNGSDFDHVKRIVLRNAYFTNLEYNINSKNNRMRITTNEPVTDDITIPPGQYDITSLLAQIVIQLDGSESSYTFTTVVPVAPQYLLSIVSSAGTIIFEPIENSIYDVLGFESFPQTPLISQVTSAIVKLHGLTRVYVKSNEIANANGHDSKDNQPNTISIIPITVGFGSQNHWETSDDELTAINYEPGRGKSLSRIDIQLHDENDRELELNGSPVELVFKVYF